MKKLQSRFAVVCTEKPSPIELLEQGLALHLAGSISEAADYYERVLVIDPNQPDALNLLGAAALSSGQTAKAIELCNHSVQAAPNHTGALCNLGNAQFAAHRFADAIQSYRRAIAIQPNSETLYNLANAQRHAGDLEGALTSFDAATQIDPQNPRPWFNRGLTLASLKRFDEAIFCLRKAVSLAPQDAGMLNHLAVTLAEHGKSREAEELLRARLQTDPLNPQTQNNLATLLIQAKRLDEARQILEETVQLEPANTRAWSNLAIALAEDHADLAVQAATQATLLEPESAEVWVLLGNIQCKHQNAKESLIAYERAFAIAPESLDENNNFGLVLNTSNRLETALEFYQRRLTKDPSDPIAHADIAISYLNSGQLGPAISHLNQSIELDPTNEYAHSNLLLVQTYSPDFPAERQLSESKKWAKAHASAIPAMPISIRPRGEKLRIGYLSADFHEHPAGRFLNALLPQHDRSRFEITIYANQLAADEVTLAIVKSADRWRIVKKMDDATLAKRIRDDGIDILVDLLGHTPNHRLKAFALKPAPVQVTWLGYFGTTGMSQMDYILADKWVLPPDLEPCFSEAPARMDGCLYLFQPPSIDAEVGPSPFATTGRVTYGCFNNTAKITPEVVRLWSRVLLAQPESRMLLNRWPYEWPSVRDRYLNHFKSAGIDPSRIEFRWTSGPEAYFRSHHEVDIMLDSIPFGGGTTSMEALWMGVPVVSMSTDRFAGRMTESILNAVGLSEMVSRSESEYIALACDLAQDPDRLKALRSRLRTQVENSSLCDLPAYTRRLEATFDRIWEQKAAPQAA